MTLLRYAAISLVCISANVWAAPMALPIAEGMPQVRLPQPRQAVLSNGLRVIVLEHAPQLPLLDVQLVMADGGGLYEPAQLRGLAGAVAEMLREGTRTRTAQEISRQLEQLGATLTAQAALPSASSAISISGLAQHSGAILELLADLVRNPAFGEADLARYASRTAAELELRRARPAFLAEEVLRRALYGEHPAGLLAPSRDMIEALRRPDLQRFHAGHYRPDAALLVVVGAVSLDAVLLQVQRVFGDWKGSDEIIAPPSPVRGWQPAAVQLVDRPGSVQTVLQAGVPGITRTDADFIAQQVMNEIVGAQPSSRLFQNLREKHGYTYGAYSTFDGGKIPGIWQARAPVRNEVTAAALKEFKAELIRIRDEPVAEEELGDAKRALIGRYLFSLERPPQLLDNLVTQALFGLPDDYWSTYPAQVAAITSADVRRIARRLIDLRHLQIVAVGDAKQIRAAVDNDASLLK